MKECKTQIVECLFDTIKECQMFSDITDMKYKKYEDGEEAVLIYSTNGNSNKTCPVWVTADSGGALIQDVWSALYLGYYHR